MTKFHPSVISRFLRALSRRIFLRERCHRPSYSTAVFVSSRTRSRRATSRPFLVIEYCGMGSNPPALRTTLNSDSGNDSARGSTIDSAARANRMPRLRRPLQVRRSFVTVTRPERTKASRSGTAIRSLRTQPWTRGDSRRTRSRAIRHGRAIRIPFHGRDSFGFTSVRRT